MMPLSQGQLNLLAICPRRFQYIYLDQFGSSTPPDQQERLTWGNRFHLLMQQRELGLPVAPLPLLADPPSSNSAESEIWQVQQCVNAFINAAPDLFQSQPESVRQAEHRRTFHVQGYLITVVYDLLILDQASAQILDWKTYPRPQQADRLASNWQTRLYPFVLAQTSDYLPEQISMTYWFVQPIEAASLTPQPLKFTYSSTLHQQTQQDLTQMLDQLTAWLDRYQAGESLPQVAESTGHCQTCLFAIRCQRGQPQAIAQTPLPALADIEEVVL